MPQVDSDKIADYIEKRGAELEADFYRGGVMVRNIPKILADEIRTIGRANDLCQTKQ